MKTPKHADTPLSVRLRDWVLERIQTLQPHALLPTDKELGHEFHLSIRSVATVMKQLAKEGVVLRIQGKGTTLPTMSSQTVSLNTVRIPSEISLYETLRKRIDSGDLRIGEALPSVKSLCLQYRLSPQTVRKTFDRLCENGLVEKSGRYYWIGEIDIERQHSPNSLVIIVFCYRGPKELRKNDLYSDLIDGVESVLQRRGACIHYCHFDQLENNLSLWRSKNSILNALLFVAFGTSDESQGQKLIELSQRFFQKSKKQPHPKIVTVGRQPPLAIPRTTVCLFGSMSISIAREAARFSSNRKYEQFLYCYQFDDGDSREFITSLRIISELRHLSPSCEIKIAVVGRSETLNSKRFYQSIIEEGLEIRLQRILERHEKLTYSELISMTQIVDSFQQVYQRKQSMWIFTRSINAVDALKWCRSHQIPVPKTVSILCLENSIATLENNISVCQLDNSILNHRIANALLGGPAAPRTQQGNMRIPVQTLERGTTV